MRNEEFSWQTADQIKLYAQLWAPEQEPTVVVCLVHGLGEHSGRYAGVAQSFTGAGFVVITFDLRGHGKSGGQRGHTPSSEAYMSDIDLLMQEAGRRYPGKPVVIYGHSLGGVLVLNYVLRRKPVVAGVIATSSGLITALHEQKEKFILSKILGSLFPSLSLASGLDVNGLSHDRAVIETYQNDPLVHNRTSVGFGKAMITAGEYVFAHASEFTVPLLLMHGSQDPIAYPRGSEKCAALAGEVATLMIWPGQLHELHNETIKDDVIAYLIAWINEKTAVHSPGQ